MARVGVLPKQGNKTLVFVGGKSIWFQVKPWCEWKREKFVYQEKDIRDKSPDLGSRRVCYVHKWRGIKVANQTRDKSL